MAIRIKEGEQSPIDEALEFAIEAVNHGEIQKAKVALDWIIKQDSNNATAWLWMACCVTDDEAKQDCYRQISSIANRS
jgi:Tfp pilus assembly protein PilF